MADPWSFVIENKAEKPELQQARVDFCRLQEYWRKLNLFESKSSNFDCSLSPSGQGLMYLIGKYGV